MKAPNEPRGIRAGIATLHGRNGEGEHAGGFEARAFGVQTGQRADKQRGTDYEDEGKGHLQSDDAFAQAHTAEAGSSALAERADQAAAARVESGSEATQKAGGETDEDSEREQA